jgi:hypothetical protein
VPSELQRHVALALLTALNFLVCYAPRKLLLGWPWNFGLTTSTAPFSAPYRLFQAKHSLSRDQVAPRTCMVDKPGHSSDVLGFVGATAPPAAPQR